MRPAQIAREIADDLALEARADLCFNEARANCAGNWPSSALAGGGLPGFNEARANCAGNLRRQSGHGLDADASMRPAQIAREILGQRRPQPRDPVLQ